jgi:hypothetical protein
MVSKAPSPLQELFAISLRKLPPENQTVIHTVLQQVVRMMGAEEVDAAPVFTTGPPAVPASAVEEFLEKAPSNLTPISEAVDKEEAPTETTSSSKKSGSDAS